MRWEGFISLENIYRAWRDFSRDKRSKADVVRFAAQLEDQLWQIHLDLESGRYAPGSYSQFIVQDPKQRVIHKASVKDRVVHRLLYNYTLPLLSQQWLDCSFSCRPGFGPYVSIQRVQRALLQATRNYTRVCFALKCDVRKFFDHIDHEILFRLLCRRVRDPKIQALLWQVIDSFSCGVDERGVPIGNLTSQIFANVYLHEFDRFAKHVLKLRHYYRYADDALILVEHREQAEELVAKIANFLATQLQLMLHPKKIIIRKSTWGIDWLGQVLLPGYRVLRPCTRRRMLRTIADRTRQGCDNYNLAGMLASYNGLIQQVAKKEIVRCAMQYIALHRAGVVA